MQHGDGVCCAFAPQFVTFYTGLLIIINIIAFQRWAFARYIFLQQRSGPLTSFPDIFDFNFLFFSFNPRDLYYRGYFLFKKYNTDCVLCLIHVLCLFLCNLIHQKFVLCYTVYLVAGINVIKTIQHMKTL